MSQIHQQNRNIRRGNARNTGCLADVDRAVQVQLLFRLDAQALDLVVIDVLRDFLLFHLLELLYLAFLTLDITVIFQGNIHLSDTEISSLMRAIEETSGTETRAVRQWMDGHRDLIDSWIPEKDEYSR